MFYLLRSFRCGRTAETASAAYSRTDWCLILRSFGGLFQAVKQSQGGLVEVAFFRYLL